MRTNKERQLWNRPAKNPVSDQIETRSKTIHEKISQKGNNFVLNSEKQFLGVLRNVGLVVRNLRQNQSSLEEVPSDKIMNIVLFTTEWR